jgi:transitional endoplasmic reticulum ATPase
LFERARQTAPSLVFIDELDAIATRRGESHEVTERVVSQLLTELDRIADHPTVVVLAATNRRDVIDPALLRPGRLETHLEVPMPDTEARREILAVHSRATPLGESVNLDELAAASSGLSGAQLEALVREASMQTIRSIARDIDPEDAAEYAEDVIIDRDAFERALDTIAESDTELPDSHSTT